MQQDFYIPQLQNEDATKYEVCGLQYIWFLFNRLNISIILWHYTGWRKKRPELCVL